MKNFKWNELKKHVGGRWDSHSLEAIPYCQIEMSDKDMLKYEYQFEYRVTLESLCRIVSELVEIEEGRSKND